MVVAAEDGEQTGRFEEGLHEGDVMAGVGVVFDALHGERVVVVDAGGAGG